MQNKASQRVYYGNVTERQLKEYFFWYRKTPSNLPLLNPIQAQTIVGQQCDDPSFFPLFDRFSKYSIPIHSKEVLILSYRE